MSEKGQGEESSQGTGTGTGAGIGADGAASGSGSQADQVGPNEGTTPTDEAIEDALKAYDDRERERTFTEGVGKPEIPDLPDEAPREPEFPGGGPADQRGDPELEEHLSEEADWQEREQRREEKRREKRGRGKSSASPELQAPELEFPKPQQGAPTDRPPGLTEEQFEEFKKQNPSILDKANTQTDVT